MTTRQQVIHAITASTQDHNTATTQTTSLKVLVMSGGSHGYYLAWALTNQAGTAAASAPQVVIIT